MGVPELFLLSLVAVDPSAATASPPKTPAGLEPCRRPSLNRDESLHNGPLGELIRYNVSVDGVEVGRVDFKVERRGAVDGKAATEYRSQFKVDRLLAALVPMEGRAASVIADGRRTPFRAMSTYTAADNRYEEKLSYTDGSTRVSSTRKKNGKSVTAERRFSASVGDFVSSFYAVRSMPRRFSGCTIIYANQRAYTIWITHDGEEAVETAVGQRPADRYRIRYGHEKAKAIHDGLIWISQTTERLPYAVEWRGKHNVRAYVHLYRR